VSDEALPRWLVMIKAGKYQKGSENCWLKAIYHDRRGARARWALNNESSRSQGYCSLLCISFRRYETEHDRTKQHVVITAPASRRHATTDRAGEAKTFYNSTSFNGEAGAYPNGRKSGKEMRDMTHVFAVGVPRWLCIGAASSNRPDGQHDSFASSWCGNNST
jgi:hypothetical protein